MTLTPFLYLDLEARASTSEYFRQGGQEDEYDTMAGLRGTNGPRGTTEISENGPTKRRGGREWLTGTPLTRA